MWVKIIPQNVWADDVTVSNKCTLFTFRFHSHKNMKVNKKYHRNAFEPLFEIRIGLLSLIRFKVIFEFKTCKLNIRSPDYRIIAFKFY